MRSFRTRSLLAAVLVAASPLYVVAQTAAPSAAVSAARQRADSVAKSFDKTEVMIPMRDGIRLHTTIWVPKERNGPLPIMFVRTPYGIASAPQALGSSYAELA